LWSDRILHRSTLPGDRTGRIGAQQATVLQCVQIAWQRWLGYRQSLAQVPGGELPAQPDACQQNLEAARVELAKGGFHGFGKGIIVHV